MGKAFVLLALLSAVIAFPAAAQNKPEARGSEIDGRIVGTWSVVSVTTHVMTIIESPRGGPEPKPVELVEPYGPNPKGRLIFFPSGHFASALVGPDRPKWDSNDSDALAALAFEASFGTYSAHPSRPNLVIFDFDASHQRQSSEVYIEIKKLTASELELETVPFPGGASYTSFVYRRAE